MWPPNEWGHAMDVNVKGDPYIVIAAGRLGHVLRGPTAACGALSSVFLRDAPCAVKRGLSPWFSY